MSRSLELEQLSELITSFPDKFSTDQLEEALSLLKARYDALDSSDLHQVISKDPNVVTVDNLIVTCKKFHKFLFDGVISIAGQFRNYKHDDNGNIYFGGQKRQEYKFQFRGSPPNQIEKDLKDAFKYLTELNPNKPLEEALRFYQKFVFTHPFYDGNGRIARLFVNLYLGWFDKFIDWKNLQDKSDFLKKLNYYHNTGIEEHFQWWMKICEKFVYDISDEDSKN